MILAETPPMLPENIAFGIIAVMMVGAALRVVTTKNVVHAALWLVFVLSGVAAMFILLASEFAGITQVLVYVGAIVVLFLFGIMLTRAELGKSDDLDNDNVQKITGLFVAGGLLVLLVGVLWDKFKDQRLDFVASSPGGIVETNTAALGQTTGQVSDSIFSTYLVAFEAASVLLLAALIGAIVLARRE